MLVRAELPVRVLGSALSAGRGTDQQGCSCFRIPYVLGHVGVRALVLAVSCPAGSAFAQRPFTRRLR